MDLSALQGFKFRYCNVLKSHKRNHYFKGIHIYTFKNENKTAYVVNVEEYEHNVFVVKFFLKKNSGNDFKYNVLTNEGCARRVIYTCVEIGLQIYAKNPLASFGFIGSPTIPEIKTTKLYNTKRFKVYQNFATFFFSPDNFIHSYSEKQSSYLLLNRSYNNSRPSALEEIKEMLKDDIESLCLPQTSS